MAVGLGRGLNKFKLKNQNDQSRKISSRSPNNSTSKSKVLNNFTKMQDAKLELLQANKSLSQSNAEVSSSGTKFSSASSNQEMLNFNHQQDQIRVTDIMKCIQALSSAIESSVNQLCAKTNNIMKSFDAIKQIDSVINSKKFAIHSQAEIIESADKLSLQKDKEYKSVLSVQDRTSQYDDQLSGVKSNIKSLDMQISELKKQLLSGGKTLQQPKLDPSGKPMIDEATGEPIMETKAASSGDIQSCIDELDRQRNEMLAQIQTITDEKGSYLDEQSDLLENFKELEQRCSASQKEKSDAQTNISMLRQSINELKEQKEKQEKNIFGLRSEKALTRKKILSDMSSKQAIEKKLERSEKASDRSRVLAEQNNKRFSNIKGKYESNILNNNIKIDEQLSKKSNFETSFDLYKSLLNKTESEKETKENKKEK